MQQHPDAGFQIRRFLFHFRFFVIAGDLLLAAKETDGLKNKTEQAVHQRGGRPCGLHLFSAESGQQLRRQDRKDQTRQERENAAQRADLVAVLARQTDAGEHGMIAEVVDCISHDRQQEIAHNDPAELCTVGQRSRHVEYQKLNADQRNDAAAEPRSGLAHFCACLFQQHTHQNIAHAVKDPADEHDRSDQAC